MAEIDSDKVREFWEHQAGLSGKIPVESLTHPERDIDILSRKLSIEREKIFDGIELGGDSDVLDLGAGTGVWSFYFAGRCRSVTAVEYCQALIEVGLQEARKRSIKNVKFVNQVAQDFVSDIRFDMIFISGLLQYLNDTECNRLIDRLPSYGRKGSILILREPTGVESRYVINDRYSELLETNYSAIYRTREELIEPIEESGFTLLDDFMMFGDETELNKWKETKLRFYRFIKQ